MARLVAHRATAAAAARSRCAHRRRRRRSGRKGRLRYPLWDHSFNRGSKENKRPSLSVVPASRASSRWAWVGVGGAQAGLWRPPKRWAGIEAPAPSADGLEARAGKPPAAGGVGTAVVPDAPAAATAAEMPLAQSAGIVSGTFPAAPSATAPGEDRNLGLYLPRLSVLLSIEADRHRAWSPGPLGPYQAWFTGIQLISEFERVKAPGNLLKSPFEFVAALGVKIKYKPFAHLASRFT